MKLKRYLFNLFLSFSCVFNALLGGMPNQSFSTRNWEWKRQGRRNVVKYIDYLLGDHHCLSSWVNWRLSTDYVKKYKKEYKDAEESVYYINQW